MTPVKPGMDGERIDALAPRASAAVVCPAAFQLGSLVILPVVTELLSWGRSQAAGGLEWVVARVLRRPRNRRLRGRLVGDLTPVAAATSSGPPHPFIRLCRHRRSGLNNETQEPEAVRLSDVMDLFVVLPGETLSLGSLRGIRAPAVNHPTELAAAICAALVHPLLDNLMNLFRQGKCHPRDLAYYPLILDGLDELLPEGQPWTEVLRGALDKATALVNTMGDLELAKDDREVEAAMAPLQPYFRALDPARCGTVRGHLYPGIAVEVADTQQGGRLTSGLITRIITEAAEDPDGIEVELESGIIGRVKRTLNR